MGNQELLRRRSGPVLVATQGMGFDEKDVRFGLQPTRRELSAVVVESAQRASGVTLPQTSASPVQQAHFPGEAHTGGLRTGAASGRRDG
jgi:hypothetical protein